ncbi:MAG: ABC transporter permease, partial [Bacteriovoracaceae bacterium]|nr:ABC transporter permease [Bacteriovoracaceae bacterium]
MTIFKIAFRDLINSKGFTLLFLFNLFLGISGFVTLHAFRENVNSLLDQRSKQLLSADLAVSGRRKLTPQELEQSLSYLEDKAQKVSSSIEVYSMAKSSGEDKRSRLVQIKGVESDFPFYGEVKLEGNQDSKAAMQGLQKKDHVWVEPQLMSQMKLKIGDLLKLGEKDFKVMGVIENDTSASLRGIGLAPKAYVGLEALKETNLISFGSVSTNVKLVKLNTAWEKKAEQVKEGLSKILKDPGLRLKLPKDASEQVGRVLNYLSDYLGLVGLVALFLSGIGSGYLFQNFLFEKLQDIAILKSVGMQLRSIFCIYLFQLALLSLSAVVIANLFVMLMLPALGEALSEWIGLGASLTLGFETFYLSFFVATGASVFICAPILFKMVNRKIKNLFEGGQFFRWSFELKDLLMYMP